MERPYVIVHILSSLDGKISGSLFDQEATKQLGKEYGNYRKELNADAWLYGTTTTKEFLKFRKPDQEKSSPVPEGDFIANDHANLYYISVDTEGEIGWESGTFVSKDKPESHVIELITEAVPQSYRSYLRKRGVSYLLVGEKQLDCQLAMEKLYHCFHIKKVLICGGGIVNWSFLSAGMVDELSLFLSPVSDGSLGPASLFTQIPDLNEGQPIEFDIKDVKRIGSGGLHINYLPKNTKK